MRPRGLLEKYLPRRVARLVRGLVPVVAFLVFWYVATTVWLDRPRLFPSPLDVGEELVRIAVGESEVGTSYEHIVATLRRLVGAFVASFVLGSLIGVVAGRKQMVFDFLGSAVWALMATPAVVWAFIFVVALGIRDLVPIAALTALLAPVVLVNVAEGAKSIPGDIVSMSTSYKVFGWRRLVDVYLPFLVPYLASSARVSFALGVKVVAVAEVVGLSRGVGFELNFWYTRLFLAPVVAWGFFLIFVGLIADYMVFGPLERRSARWRVSGAGDTGAGGAVM